MSRFVNVISTKRSGHHAFIEWYRMHHPVSTVFLNNHPLNDTLSKHLISHVASRQNIPLILNYEGAMPSGVQKTILHQTNLSDDIKSIVFLRDPLNVLASLIHRKQSKIANLVMIARQLLAQRYWLLDRQSLNSGFLHVSYNSWLFDASYRTLVSETLGLQSHELSNAITPQGGGSSFGHEKELSGGDRLKLAKRWHGYRGEPFFEALAAHPIFAKVFHQAYCGCFPDSFNGTFADDEARDYLEKLSKRRRSISIVNHLIHRLADRIDLFEKMDSAGSTGKKPLILRAYLTAVVP